MQVFLIRHPRPQVADGVCYGQLDLPAIEVEQTAAVLLAQLPPNLPVISSPLQRCRALAEALHPAPRLMPGLMEMNFGEWEGRHWDDIGTKALDAWAADVLHHVPPGGESAAMLQARSVTSFNLLAIEGLPACVVITHAGVIRAAVGHVRQFSAEKWSQLKFDYGECVALSWPAENLISSPHRDPGSMTEI